MKTTKKLPSKKEVMKEMDKDWEASIEGEKLRFGSSAEEYYNTMENENE